MSPRDELRAAMITRLRSDAYCNEHFALSAHAEDIADLVTGMFHAVSDDVEVVDTTPMGSVDEEGIRQRWLRAHRVAESVPVRRPRKQGRAWEATA